MRGVDISHYQEGLTIRQIRDAGNDFAIIKVTEGTWHQDAAAFDFYREAYEMRFPAGCYCYSHALTPEDVWSEAQFLLDTIKGFPMPCGIYLDMEEPGQLALARERLSAIVAAWCAAISTAGYVPGIYGSEYGIWANLDPETLPVCCLAWVAHYGKEPEIPCDLWQSGDSGHIDGFDGRVDTDEVRSERFKMMVERGLPSQTQIPETAPSKGEPSEPDIPDVLALLGAYIQTQAFRQRFLDYIHKTEAGENE